ncbi:phosphate transport system regulatory protein PhoU [Halobacteriales archaeon SW_5_70_135]|nr:MAG: phosphate transport system regulatory protein PhoU [Halobacteriales archaeon SW_5_70_135]
MSRESYQEQIDELRASVVEMSEVVVDQLRTAIEAVEHRDGDLGREAEERDADVNRRYLAIESDCVDLLALQQPVAGDLRFIVASFKIVTDLERVGDLATNLGQYAAAAERDRYPAVDVGQIGTVAAEMVEDATHAYADEDADLCREIDARDDYLDDLCGRASRTVTEELLTADSPDDIEAVVADVRRLLLTVRDLERVGDHAVNVAGRTLYAVENSEELLR